jgi:hypothetical protein
MIEIAGHGAAMPSAPVAVQLAARYIAPPLAEEGAARLIEDLVLSGTRAAAVAGRRLEAATLERQAAMRGLAAVR